MAYSKKICWIASDFRRKRVLFLLVLLCLFQWSCNKPTYTAANMTLSMAATTNDIKVVKQHLAKGTDPNARHEFEYPPLFAAVESGNIEIVRLLLEAGADASFRYGDDWTVLHQLTYGREDKSVKLIDLLITHGADPEAKDGSGAKASEVASDSGRFMLAAELRQRGA